MDNNVQEKQDPGAEPSKPVLVNPQRSSHSSLLARTLAVASAGAGGRLLLPTRAVEPERTPEELARAEAVSTAKLSAAEAKRQRRQQRNLRQISS